MLSLGRTIWWTVLMTMMGLSLCWPFRKSQTIKTIFWNNWVQARSAQGCLSLLSWSKDLPLSPLLLTLWSGAGPESLGAQETWHDHGRNSELHQLQTDYASVLLGSGKGIWLMCDLGKSSRRNLNVPWSGIAIPAKRLKRNDAMFIFMQIYLKDLMLRGNKSKC